MFYEQKHHHSKGEKNRKKIVGKKTQKRLVGSNHNGLEKQQKNCNFVSGHFHECGNPRTNVSAFAEKGTAVFLHPKQTTNTQHPHPCFKTFYCFYIKHTF